MPTIQKSLYDLVSLPPKQGIETVAILKKAITAARHYLNSKDLIEIL